MIVTCSSCSTRFTVDPAVLGAHGRRVRCVRCGHVWHQMPEAATVAPTPVAAKADLEPAAAAPPPAVNGSPSEAAPEPEAESAAGAARHHGGWRLFFAVAFLLAVAVFTGQERIVAVWPAAARLYETVGLAEPVPGRSLEIRDVTPETRLDAGSRILVVSGIVVNPTASTVDAPVVRAVLLDESGNVLSELTTGLGLASLRSGQEAGFAVEFTEPPEPAARVTIGFEAAGGS